MPIVAPLIICASRRDPHLICVVFFNWKPCFRQDESETCCFEEFCISLGTLSPSLRNLPFSEFGRFGITSQTHLNILKAEHNIPTLSLSEFLVSVSVLIKESKICNFAEDNTIFASGQNIEQIAVSLELDLAPNLEWFDSNCMVANSGKFQVMFLGLNINQKLHI